MNAVMHNTPEAMRSMRKYLNIFPEEVFEAS